jgi:hypothetical protein
MFQRYWILSTQRHFNGFEMSVHCQVDTYKGVKKRKDHCLPTMVPDTIVPFFSSIVTVSLLNFIKKRTSFMFPYQKMFVAFKELVESPR